ncbi:MAG: hypothetical protein Q8L98_03080 [Chlamydiales bacterium]|nr:hypothetical protein [Chlamydiales bacterium]
MIPISPKIFFSPSEWGDFSKDEEDFQTSTTQKSSQVAQAVFSSPSQSIKDRDLPHSLDFTDYLLSPSDIQSKDMSYYEQGPFSPEDLVVESTGYKRLRSPINESRVSKRICLSKPKDCQDPISVSDEFDSEEQRVLQMDEFSQMVQTAEVLDPSREEWMSGPPLDSNEEFTQFMQEELFQIEANSDFQESVDGNEKEADEEIERRLSLLDTIGRGSHTETSPIERIEKFDEQKINLKDRFILNAIYESRGLLGYRTLAKELNKKNVMVTEDQVSRTLTKYDLETTEKRRAEHIAGWPRFNAMPFSIEPGSEKLIPLPYQRFKINDPIMEETVVRLALENPQLGHRGIANQLNGRDFYISKASVGNILVKKNLSTRRQRLEAAMALSTQDHTSDSLDLSDFAFSPSSIVLEDSNEEQISSVLKPFEGNQQSIPQLDCFSQTVDTWEEWMSGSPQPPLELMQEELFQIEANSDLQEAVDGNEKEADEEELSILETVGMDSHSETSKITGVEKLDDKTITLKDQFILNAVYESRGVLGCRALAKELNKKNVMVSIDQVDRTLKKYDLATTEKRREEHISGWPRFNAMPFPIEPGAEKLFSLDSKRYNKVTHIIQETVARLAREKPELSCRAIANELNKPKIVISEGSVYRILVAKNLSTLGQRQEAAKTLSTQDQTLSDSLDLSDYAFSPSNILLEDSNEEQISSVLRPFDANEQSISQLDHFSQMADTWEALAPSREERIGESPLYSDEESIQFMQEELFQIEANSDLQEGVDGNEKEADEEELSILETVGMGSHMATPQIKGIEKFDDQKINLKDRIVLNAVHESRGLLGSRALAKELNKKNVIVNEAQVAATLTKYVLNSKEKRIAEHAAGWPRFNAMPFPIEPGAEKSALFYTSVNQINDAGKFDESTIGYKDQIVLNAIHESRGLDGSIKVYKKLVAQGETIDQREVDAIFYKFNLISTGNRIEAVETGWPAFNNPPPFHVEPRSQRSAPLPSNPGKIHERLQKNNVEKFDESTIGYKDRIVLNVIHESRGLDGTIKVYNKLVAQGETINQKEVAAIFHKFKLVSAGNRTAAVEAGWPAFNNPPPFDIE